MPETIQDKQLILQHVTLPGTAERIERKGWNPQPHIQWKQYAPQGRNGIYFYAQGDPNIERYAYQLSSRDGVKRLALITVSVPLSAVTESDNPEYGIFVPRENLDQIKTMRVENFEHQPTTGWVKTGKTGDARPTEANTREFAGLPIVVEWDAGEIRKGKTEDGKEWERIMAAPYGYILGTRGAGDKEGVDVYLGMNEDAPSVYVIEQLKADGTLDEYKVMLGFDNEEEALDLYLKHYPKSWRDERLGEVTAFPMAEFREVVFQNSEEKTGYGSKTAAKKKFYHGTKTKNLEDIMKNGLRVDKSDAHNEWDHAIYLACDAYTAKNYEGMHGNGEPWTILEIDGSKLNEYYMRPDDYDFPDLWEESGKEGNWALQDWRVSLRVSCQIAYLADIPPTAIKVLSEKTAGKRPETGPLYQKLLQLRPAMAQAAQRVYDEWDQEEMDGGGICDEIASEIEGVIVSNMGDVNIMSGGHDGDDHAWLIAYNDADTESYGVDIPASVYERGGGYSWTKIPDIQFSAQDVDVFPLDVDPKEFKVSALKTARGKFPTFKQFMDNPEWSRSVTSPSNQKEYRFMALEYDERIDFLSSLTFPMTVYRAIELGRGESINTEEFGIYWTHDPNSADTYFGSNSMWSNKPKKKGSVEIVIVEAQIMSEADVDWDQTLKANILNPQEEEITVYPGTELHVVSIESDEGKTSPPFKSVKAFKTASPFEHGYCWEWALAYQELRGGDLYVVVGYHDEDGESVPEYAHAFVSQDGRTGTDSRGTRPMNEIIAECRFDNDVREKTVKKLNRADFEQFFPENEAIELAKHDIQTKTAAAHALVLVNVPAAAAKEILERGKSVIPDDDLAGDGRETRPHITIRYGVEENVKKLQAVLRDQPAFTVTLGRLQVFQPGPSTRGTCPIVAEINAPEFHALHDAVDALGNRAEDFQYSPHVTIAYVRPEVAERYRGSDAFEGIGFPVDEVVLSTREKQQTPVPLGKTASTAAAYLPSLEKVVQSAVGGNIWEAVGDWNAVEVEARQRVTESGRDWKQLPEPEREALLDEIGYEHLEAQWEIAKKHLAGLEFPLMVYRAMGVENQADLHANDFGAYWSYNENNAYVDQELPGWQTKKIVIFRAVVNPDDIDWMRTSWVAMMVPEEHEIDIKPGMELSITGWKEKGATEWRKPQKRFKTVTATPAWATTEKTAALSPADRETIEGIGGGYVLDEAEVGDYDLALIGTDLIPNFYQIGMQRRGLSMVDTGQQMENQTMERMPTEGRKTVFGLKGVIDKWLKQYGRLYMASHNPEKTAKYMKVLRLLGYQVGTGTVELMGQEITAPYIQKTSKTAGVVETLKEFVPEFRPQVVGFGTDKAGIELTDIMIQPDPTGDDRILFEEALKPLGFVSRGGGSHDWVFWNDAENCMLDIWFEGTKTAELTNPDAKTICGWCKKVIREGTEPASHTICADCRQTHFPETVKKADSPQLSPHRHTEYPQGSNGWANQEDRRGGEFGQSMPSLEELSPHGDLQNCPAVDGDKTLGVLRKGQPTTRVGHELLKKAAENLNSDGWLTGDGFVPNGEGKSHADTSTQVLHAQDTEDALKKGYVRVATLGTNGHSLFFEVWSSEDDQAKQTIANALRTWAPRASLINIEYRQPYTVEKGLNKDEAIAFLMGKQQPAYVSPYRQFHKQYAAKTAATEDELLDLHDSIKADLRAAADLPPHRYFAKMERCADDLDALWKELSRVENKDIRIQDFILTARRWLDKANAALYQNSDPQTASSWLDGALTNLHSILYILGHGERKTTPDLFSEVSSKEASGGALNWRGGGFIMPDGSLEYSKDVYDEHSGLAVRLGLAERESVFDNPVVQALNKGAIRFNTWATWRIGNKVVPSTNFQVGTLDSNAKARMRDYVLEHPTQGVVIEWGPNHGYDVEFNNTEEAVEWLESDSLRHTSARLFTPGIPTGEHDVPGYVYLLHFDQPFHHARHYLGWTSDPDARIRAHREGTSGVRLMEAVHDAGIGFQTARVWKNVTRKFERRLKNQGGLSRHCPVCIQNGLVCPSRVQNKSVSVPEGTDYVETCDVPKTSSEKVPLEDILKFHDEIKDDPRRLKTRHASHGEYVYKMQQEKITQFAALLVPWSSDAGEMIGLANQYLRQAEERYAKYQDSQDPADLEAALYLQENALMHLHGKLTRYMRDAEEQPRLEAERQQRSQERQQRIQERRKRMSSRTGAQGWPILRADDTWVRRAELFLRDKWDQRHRELGREGESDFSSACKFGSAFAQKLFGGRMVGNPDHQALKLPDGRMLDLTGFYDPNTFYHDEEFWMNPEHEQSMKSCEPRVHSWVDEFMNLYRNDVFLTRHANTKDGGKKREKQKQPRTDVYKQQWEKGEKAWFEYHCFESDDSTDAELWHRSHKRVTVLGEGDADGSSKNMPDSTAESRAENGTPRIYRIQFSDGKVFDAAEDELMTSREGFYRPDPPSKTTDTHKAALRLGKSSRRYTWQQVADYLGEMPGWEDYPVGNLIHDIAQVWELREVNLGQILTAAGSKMECQYPQVARGYAQAGTPFPPVILDMGGSLVDGQHRCCAAIERGDTRIQAWVPVARHNASLIGSVEFLKPIMAIKF